MDKLVSDIIYGSSRTLKNEVTGETTEYNYYFDKELAERPIEFIEEFCKPTKGAKAGSSIKLDLWQKAFISAVYGFVDKETKLRKYTKVILFIGRKNGKTTLASALGIYQLIADGEMGAEVYSVATKKDQAKLLWTEAHNMVACSRELKKIIDLKYNMIAFPETRSTFLPLSSKSSTLDGLNASVVFCDEVHAWVDMNMIDVMYDSISTRRQPLFFEFSTMGTVRNSVFDKEYSYCERVIEGYKNGKHGIVDDKLLPFIYELDDKEEIYEPEKWVKANPGLGTIKSYDYLDNKLIQAQNDSSKLANTYCKDFNVRMTENFRWLEYDDIYNELTYDDDIFNHTYAIGGVDLSATTDLTCATILIEKEGIKYVKQQYFIPEEVAEEKEKIDKVPYREWARQGYITLCEGNVVDYQDVTNWFNEMKEKHDILFLAIGYDSWHSSYWVKEMESYGYPLFEVIQGARTMSSPMKRLKGDLKDKKVNFNCNPVLQWNLINTTIKEDDNGNIRPVKGKSAVERIDGTVSLIDAYVALDAKYEEYSVLQD